MSTLRVDNIKSRTGTTVTIPDSQNLAITGALTVSGSQSFGAGASLSLQGENINSGTRGDILYYDSNGQIAKLAIGAAGAVLKSDGTDVEWGAIGGATNVYYVSTNGVDAQGRGGSIDTAFRTLKYATQNVGSPTINNPAVIFVKAGTYEEIALPIVVPPFTTIVGDNLRATIIKPGTGLDSSGSVLNTRSTLFRLSNGTIIQDMVLDGMGGYVPGTPAHDPEAGTLGGVYFALNASSVISDKSPYIYNVTSFGAGATGAYVDGSLHGSGNRSMLFHTYTAIHSDGLGIWADSNSNVEIISGFTYYCQVGYAATGGSKIRSLNSSNSYGEFGVYSAGFDAGEVPNTGSVAGIMLAYTGVLTSEFTLGEQITGGTSGATAYVANFQAEPKVIYIVGKTGTFQANEVVTGATSGATATLEAANVEVQQSGRILVTTFANSADPGDSLQFATTDGNAYQIQTVSSVTANNVAYHVLVFSTSRPTPVPSGTGLNVRKEFSLVRLTGHDFLQIGTGDSTSTNWPGNPTQPPSQADQVVTNSTDPGRVYYVATDDLGNFYVGDQFKVDQATGKVTLDSSAFDLTGLESLRLGSLGGLVGASVNEFSTDGTLSQNSDEKVPTQAAVKTYVDGLSGVSGNFTIGGNLTVTGTTTTINTANTTINDKLIELANGTSGSPSGDAGIIIERGSENNVFIGWDETEDVVRFGLGTFTGTTTGDLTFTDANVLFGNIQASRITTNEVIEIVSIKADSAASHALNLSENAVHYFTTNPTQNWTFNLRGDATTPLDNIMAIGDSMTVATLVSIGATPYYMTTLQIDGTTVTPKWVSAPTAGTANSIEVYTFTVVKTAASTFTVLATVTPYV
jgi:hypothetical protein